MAPSPLLLLILPLLFASFLSAASQKPRALVVPVVRNAATLQYVARVSQRSPPVPLDLVVDVGGPLQWVLCDDTYVSSSYRPVPCRSPVCPLLKNYGCTTACYGSPPAPPAPTTPALPSRSTPSGATPLPKASSRMSCLYYLPTAPSQIFSTFMITGDVTKIPNVFFSCGSRVLLQGLACGAAGMAGLGRGKLALPTQIAARLRVSRKFALCLPSSSGPGAMFFGEAPSYTFQLDVDAAKSLMYTPLITAGAGTDDEGYFIGVRGIKFNGKAVPLDAELLAGASAKISTAVPYTVLESSIYRAVTSAFLKETALQRLKAVKPFELCFNGSGIGSTRVGPAVPSIDLVLQNKGAEWMIFGSNSMVWTADGVLCLGLVEAAKDRVEAPIVIGGHQLEDNLLEFDIARSRLGFTSSLLFRQTTCSNFNFGITA
uniref:Peptidase A1 domain-containing protein n=1 Tax=Ananas comosus var. bracteatus TaxID=296719 RepID=A0A6V7QC40_ANACO|nr:unnamed protein product [Ananas comosus var. bracteatus]